MRRDLASASGLERALECRASMVLDSIESTSADAEAGSAIHAFLCDVNMLGHDKALARVPEPFRPMCDVIDPRDYPLDPKQYAAEVALAYNVVTGTARELGRNIGRRYVECGLLVGEEIPGSPDVLGLLPGAVYVGDYKRGGHHVTPAKFNAQMRFNALAACRLYGRERAIVDIIRIFDGDTKPYHDRAEVDLFDLDDFAHSLRVWRERVAEDRRFYAEGTMPPTTLGDWCRYCPSYVFCDGQTGLIRRAVGGQIDTRLDAGRAAEAYAMWRQIETLAKKMGEQLKGLARQQPIPLPKGKVYSWEPGESTVIDAVLAEPILAKSLSEKAAAVAVKKSVTGESLDAAIAAYLAEQESVGKGEASALLERVKGELRQGGALTMVPGGATRERKAKALPPAPPTPMALPAPKENLNLTPEYAELTKVAEMSGEELRAGMRARAEEVERERKAAKPKPATLFPAEQKAAPTPLQPEAIPLFPTAVCSVCGGKFVTNPGKPRTPPTRCPSCEASGLMPPKPPKPPPAAGFEDLTDLDFK